jgi:Uma2 family endonuclease
MAETDLHRILMTVLIQTLEAYYASNPRVYVSGNLLIFYERGNRRRHVSPDVFVVKGIPKHPRDNYLLWQEGKGPDMVIELTSRTTREEDLETKYELYQERLEVKEYFLFDPREEYLDPALEGYRLRQGGYRLIRPVNGRLPSQVLGLHLERAGTDLRLWNPATGVWVPTPAETLKQIEEARQHAEAARRRAEEGRQQAEAEAERLRREVEALRRQAGK